MFAKLLAHHRRRLSLTQEELAVRTGLSVRTIRGLEAGRVRPRASSVRLLVDAFGLTGGGREDFVAGARPADAPGGPAATVVPAQLPADVRGFAGRCQTLATLDALLPSLAHPSPAMAVAAVSGVAGTGKTTLAVHWAHRVRDRFPDGQLYVNLRGYDATGRAVTEAEALTAFLSGLGVPPQRIPPDPQARAGMFRSLCDGKRLLVVLDNARDTEQVRPLLPGTPTTVVVVTSRDRLTPLIAAMGAHPLRLPPLTAVESQDLLRSRLGADRVTAEQEAVDRIVAACGGLPMALTIIAARAQQSTFPIATLAAELAGECLDALDTGDPASGPRAVFSWSYDALSPPAARLFRLLGLHPGPDISVPAAAALAGLPSEEVRPWLRELDRVGLLTEHAPGRYAFHDLIRAFAADLARRHDSDPTRRTEVTRLLDHYAHTGSRARQELGLPLHVAPPGPDRSDAAGPQLSGSEEAAEWFRLEIPLLLACIDHAASSGSHRHVCQTADTLIEVLDRWARCDDL